MKGAAPPLTVFPVRRLSKKPAKNIQAGFYPTGLVGKTEQR
jgi:hypothetical protein